jgi:hypothetical protein
VLKYAKIFYETSAGFTNDPYKDWSRAEDFVTNANLSFLGYVYKAQAALLRYTG